MLRFVIVILIVLRCATAVAGELQRGNIHIAGPLIKLVAGSGRLTDVCRLNGNHITACTLFVGYRLEGRCRPKASMWSAEVSARFTPMVYLGDIQSMTHERDHIEDVRFSLGEYLQLLERREFSSFDDCHHAVVQEAERFEETLRGFARESTRKRHPKSILAAEAPRVHASN